MLETQQPLLGRERELRLLSELVDGSGGQGSALLIRGSAGVGKSTLVQAAMGLADSRGIPTLSVTGFQSEAQLAFAGLHQLVAPVLHHASRLPEGQRDALMTAFGMLESDRADSFLIALATLELLGDIAQNAGLLVSVGDAQWIDGPTLGVLSFVARRCEAARVTLLIEIRDGYASELLEVGLRELVVGPLDDTSARALLDRHAAGGPSSTHEAVLRVAAGNPLAIVELPLAMSDERVASGFASDDLPLTARLERAFGDRLTELPRPARTVMLVAAESDEDFVDEVVAAARLVDASVDADSLDAAVRAALIAVEDGRIRMRHPLVRSAVRVASSPRQRIRAHWALAQGLAHSPDRQVWHRAGAASIPDDRLAADLEALAERTVRRGGVSAAVAALERSAQLTSGTEDRGRRYVAAAEVAVEAGDLAAAIRLVRSAEKCALHAVDQGKLTLVRDTLNPGRPGEPAGVLTLARLASEMVDIDPDLALRALHAAAAKSWLADPGSAARATVAATADSLPAQDDPRLLPILAFADPEGRGSHIVDRAMSLEPSRLAPRDADAVGVALNLIGDFDLSASFLEAAVTGLRREERLGLLPEVLAHQSWTAINTGNWPVAVAAADEGIRLARLTNQVAWEAASTAAQAMIAGLRGDLSTAELLANGAERLALPTRAAAVLAGIQLARGSAALADGNYQSAYDQLRRTFDPADPSYHHFQRAWTIGDFVEAAVRSSHRDEATARVDELEQLVRDSRSSWLVAGLTFARPILADDHAAEGSFHAALEADLSGWPLYRGRLLYQYGAWLRRQRRIVQARIPLREARDWFDRHGLLAWSVRAREELRASGENSRRPAPEAWTSLSPQELQVALMAADGLTNADIARRLFLSHRTVGSHLYRVFPKLSITSRAQLRAALEARESDQEADL